MKIENITKYTTKILELKLINSKIFTNKLYKNNIKLEDITYRLKRVFQIIFKYHMFNKKIVFIGAPNNKNLYLKKLLKKTTHIFIPCSLWARGALSNKKYCFKDITKNINYIDKKISKLLVQLKKKVNLIVIFNENNNLNIINEGYKSKVPVISLNSNLNFYYNKSNYKIPGNFQFLNKKNRDNLFYVMLFSILKKGNKLKKQKELFVSKKKKLFVRKQKKIHLQIAKKLSLQIKKNNK